MRTKGSVLIVLILGLGTALAMAVSGRDDGAIPDVVGVADRKSSNTGRLDADQHEQLQSDIRFDLSAIKRTVPENIQTGGLFQSQSWYVPQPPLPSAPPADSLSQSPPPPPPPPSAPQLPFTFIGRIIDGNEVTLFLMKNDQQYNARLGDILDGAYRVDQITGKSAVLTYLPMNIQQELVFNSDAVGISALSASASDTTMQPPVQPQQQIEIPQ